MSTTERRDRTELDDVDEDILLMRATRRAQKPGPRVGDYCIMSDGDVRRFTHDWDDSIQLTPPGEAGSFYLDASGNLDYSGGLVPAIDKSRLRPRTELREGPCWFFHHDRHRADNGVTALIPCRVYEEIV